MNYMSYPVCVPFMTRYRSQKEWGISVEELKRADVEEVFLIYYRKLADRAARDKMNALFLDNKEHLEKSGFRVSAWVAPTIGYGSAVDEVDRKAAQKYQRIRNSLGQECIAFCPLDVAFLEDLCEQFAEVAQTGVKRILLEDDFTLTGGKMGLQAMGCLCDRHLKKLSEKFGRTLTREELHSCLVSGKRNAYRDAVYAQNGEALLNVAHAIEQAVHRVDPEIRLGLSANSSSYHLEGVSFAALERTLAGNTAPFVRMTGAPYWKDNAATILPVIETARMQSAFMAGEHIECLTEGDTYPRPRFVTPAAHLEMFDMITRADGHANGILKYMLDYNSSDSYETGYIDHHIDNRALYEELERRFGGHTVGLRMFEVPFSLAEADFDDTFTYLGFVDHGILPTVAEWFVTDCSLPTTYENNTNEAQMVFGRNAAYLPLEACARGLILDIAAAKILASRGIDVGFTEITPAPKAGCEYFPDKEDITTASTERDGGFFRVTLSPGAEVLSTFYATDSCLGTTSDLDDSTERYPACYRYENAAGQRFLVYTFAADEVKTKGSWHNGLFRNYYRAEQVIDSYAWLCGHKLPAVCRRAPHLYVLCKREGEKLHIGLFNLSPDAILHPVVELDKTYATLDCFNTTGKLRGDRLELERMPAYTAAFLTVE